MRILDLLTPARVVVDAAATSKTRLLEKLAKLKPAFGWFVLAMGIYIITKEVSNLH